MNKPLVLLCVLILFISLDCSEKSNPTQSAEEKEHFASMLEIKTEKSEYFISRDFPDSFAVVIGTLINTSQDTFYSKLGDGINASIDQNSLHIANRTDGFFEKNGGGNTWTNADQAWLIEGSKVVRILPSRQYTFDAPAHLRSNSVGRYRLRILYYRSYSQSVADTLKDTSNTFFILE